MTLPRGLAPRTVFVDSSAFFAALDRRDARHRDASRCFQQLSNDGRSLLTSNLVIAESHGLMLRKLGRNIAAAWLEQSADLNVVFEDETDNEAAREIVFRYDDKDFSYTDALSFVLMERLGIGVAFAFDDDFRQYGLDVIP